MKIEIDEKLAIQVNGTASLVEQLNINHVSSGIYFERNRIT